MSRSTEPALAYGTDEDATAISIDPLGPGTICPLTRS